MLASRLLFALQQRSSAGLGISSQESPSRTLFPEGNSILKSREQNKTTSLDNLPRINQRREVEADDVHLQFDSIVVLNHGANDGILDFAVVKVYADFIAEVEFALWCLGHGRNLRLTDVRCGCR